MRNGLDILPKIQKNSRSDQEEMEDPTFAQTLVANLSYRYSPAIDYIRELKNFGFAPPLEDGFNPMDMACLSSTTICTHISKQICGYRS